MRLHAILHEELLAEIGLLVLVLIGQLRLTSGESLAMLVDLAQEFHVCSLAVLWLVLRVQELQLTLLHLKSDELAHYVGVA